MLERLHYIMYIANIADADQPARIHDLSTSRQFFLRHEQQSKTACTL